MRILEAINETTFVNIVTVFDLLLIGGLMLVIPSVMRRGLLFGAYVGEEAGESQAASELRRHWRTGVLLLTALGLLLGLGLGLGLMILVLLLLGAVTGLSLWGALG